MFTSIFIIAEPAVKKTTNIKDHKGDSALFHFEVGAVLLFILQRPFNHYVQYPLTVKLCPIVQPTAGINLMRYCDCPS